MRRILSTRKAVLNGMPERDGWSNQVVGGWALDVKMGGA